MGGPDVGSDAGVHKEGGHVVGAQDMGGGDAGGQYIGADGWRRRQRGQQILRRRRA